MWWLGDWWAFGERKGYGERKRVVESEDWDGPSFEVCRNAGYVARRIEASCRHDALPWSTHAELARVEDVQERAELLDRAAEERWTQRQARAEVSKLKAAKAIGAPVASDGTCTVADLWRLVENVLRKPFLPSEAAAIAQAVEEEERRAAKERQREAAQRTNAKLGRSAPEDASLNLREASVKPDKSEQRQRRTDEKAARAAGVSAGTLRKIKAVVDSGDEDLIAKMDRTGKADGAYKELQRRERAEEEAKARSSGNAECRVSVPRNLSESDPPLPSPLAPARAWRHLLTDDGVHAALVFVRSAAEIPRRLRGARAERE